DRTYANAFLVTPQRAQNTARRAAYRASYERLMAAGVPRLAYLEGEKPLRDDGEATVDSSHPTDLGFMRQAAALEAALRPLLSARVTATVTR
ncbi:MAG: hypothetical protein DMG07_04965, partial [Acidobacteria bacterium]